MYCTATGDDDATTATTATKRDAGHTPQGRLVRLSIAGLDIGEHVPGGDASALVVNPDFTSDLILLPD